MAPPSTKAAGPPQQTDRLQQSFLREEQFGLLRGMQLRVAIVPIIMVWLAVESGYPELLFFEALSLLFLVLGLGPYLLTRAGRYRPYQRYLFPALEIVILAIANFVPNPLSDDAIPPQMLLRFGNELYAFLFIAGAAFTYRPRVILWTGFFASLVWAVATLIIYSLPESLPDLGRVAGVDKMSPEELHSAIMHPRRIHLGLLGRQAIVFLLTSAAIAAFVARSRQLVRRHSETERQRSNLSRYFSSNMVEELSQLDDPLGATREQDVAVLFVDIVSFTTLSEKLSAEDLIDLLREFHGRMEQAVFANGGTLDKYLGDGIMATFGTPRPGPNDATNVLDCIHDMTVAMAEWNRNRAAVDELPIAIGIGAHYGPVVLGDIGGDQRLEFAVLGDTVNVASRIEELTRKLEVVSLISEELLDAARQEGASEETTATYRFAHSEDLRGRSAETRLWAPISADPVTS